MPYRINRTLLEFHFPFSSQPLLICCAIADTQGHEGPFPGFTTVSATPHWICVSGHLLNLEARFIGGFWRTEGLLPYLIHRFLSSILCFLWELLAIHVFSDEQSCMSCLFTRLLPAPVTCLVTWKTPSSSRVRTLLVSLLCTQLLARQLNRLPGAACLLMGHSLGCECRYGTIPQHLQVHPPWH